MRGDVLGLSGRFVSTNEQRIAKGETNYIQGCEDEATSRVELGHS